ncbi:hypothetical protein [Agromyces seonyuensis]|uniref:Galactose mutarotase n=1 Tax=Agromyces seonyuensis TaxID=2662446 RepID=A0A6I4NWU9_9MICO|nr:hypothetical protein [Agromyces seonyuensis]MWB96965.1 hypothetical protein [Agromyces seonyuensis]
MIRLESAQLQVEVDASRGGRVTSIRTDREWLAPSSDARPGARYGDEGAGGWDEALPTIGGEPDHGDLWDVEWEIRRATRSTAVLAATSSSAGIELERTLSVQGRRLGASYVARNMGTAPSTFLWAAHALFAADDGTIATPVGGGRWYVEYPAGTDLQRMPARWASTPRSGVKAFVPAAEGVDLVHADGPRAEMRWRPSEIPWLGLYWDTGEFGPGPVVGLEPTNTGSDRRTSSSWTLAASAERRWRFALELHPAQR